MPSYLDEVLADSPAGLWLLNETSGTDATDYVDTRTFRNGHYVGGPTLGAPALTGVGPSVETTSTSYVSVPVPSDILGNNYSFELAFRYISGPKVFADSGNKWSLDVSGTNPVLTAAGAVHTVTAIASSALTDGLRHHLVLTTEAGTGSAHRLYVDGSLVDTWTPAFPTWPASFFFGKDSGGTYSPGAFSAVAFYNSTLSAARVSAHFNALDSYNLTPVEVAVTPQPLTVAQDSHTLAPLDITVSVAALTQPADLLGTRTSPTGGIRLASTATATWDPPVVAPPAPLPERVVATFGIDSVVWDGTDAKPQGPVASKPRARHRIVVGGKDVTFFRGVQTPLPEYGLQSPLLYGAGMLRFPQIHAALERPGVGELSWLTKDARVKVQRVDSSGAVVATDFLGTVGDFRQDGRDFSCTLSGDATGPAGSTYRAMPVFPTVSDIGTQVMRAIQHQLRLPTANEPTTGVQIMETGAAWHLDWLTEILAKSTQRDGTQWTVMPNAQGQYKMQAKDLTTVDATVYIDGYRNSQSLRRDFSTEFNRVWAQGVDPDGKRIRFLIVPGMFTTDLAYPGSPLAPGDTGDNVTALIWRLYTLEWLTVAPFGLEWTTDPDDPVTAAIEDVQEAAGLTAIAGHVDGPTWRAIFRGDDASLRRSQIKPAAQKMSTQAFLRDATGNIIGANPSYDRTRQLRDAVFDMGAGFSRRQIEKWAKRQLANPDVPNVVGTITINTGAVIEGEHNPGDPLTMDLVKDARSLKPGMNVWLPNYEGGTLVHVSGVNVTDTSVELAVDSQARDTMPVWEVINRNRQSRKSPARIWEIENKRSHLSDDTGAIYDGGPFGKIERTFVPANTWVVAKSMGGRSGTLETIKVQTENSQALFVMAVFGKEVHPGRLDNVIGNPLAAAGTANWEDRAKTLTDDMCLIYTAGGVSDDGISQPCGYWPGRVKVNSTDGTAIVPPVTGEWRDYSGANYYCKGSPVLWTAFYADRDTWVQGGRVLELLLDDAAG